MREKAVMEPQSLAPWAQGMGATSGSQGQPAGPSPDSWEEITGKILTRVEEVIGVRAEAGMDVLQGEHTARSSRLENTSIFGEALWSLSRKEGRA